MSSAASPGSNDDDDRVPLFGTWPAIYVAVAACAVAVMALALLFSRWPF